MVTKSTENLLDRKVFETKSLFVAKIIMYVLISISVLISRKEVRNMLKKDNGNKYLLSFDIRVLGIR